MCYSPVFIQNNSTRKVYGYKPYMFVPCGHCFACRSARSQSYFLRCAYEMRSYPLNSLVLFVLLTYNDFMLPFVTPDQMDDFSTIGCKGRVSKNSCFEYQGLDPDSPYNLPEDLNLYKLPCFQIEHIDLFFKKLRYRLFRIFGYKVRISYFLVAENGDEKKRPHYHIILFFDLAMNDYNFNICKALVTDSWSKRMSCSPYPCHRKDKDGNYLYYKNGKPKTYKKCTRDVPFGYVMFDEENGKQFVKLQDINKTASYLSQYLVQDPYFEDVHRSNLEQLSPRNKRIYIKRFGNFRLTSKFFGINGLLSLNESDINSCSMRLDGKEHVYRMPLYYQRYVYTDSFRFERSPETRCEFGLMEIVDSRFSPCSFRTLRYRPYIIKRERKRVKQYQFKNMNWYKMRVAQFPKLYDSLYNSFLAFRHFFSGNNDFSPYLEMYAQYMSASNISPQLSRFATMTNHNVTEYLDMVSVEKLLGYYLLFFNNYKNDSCSKSALLYLYTPYVVDNIGKRDFVQRAYSDFLWHSMNAPFSDSDIVKVDKDSKISQTKSFELVPWMLPYELLCVLFHAYQHEHLKTINKCKVVEWNTEAEHLRKAKYKIRCY